MKFRLLLPLVLLTSFAARADLRLLASATSDSYQSLTYGLSAFCQAAGFPFALTEINDKASDLLLIPNLGGIDVQRPLWLFWLADDAKDPETSDVVSVAMLPTTDPATAALQALTNTYPVRVEEAEHLWRYTRKATPAADDTPVGETTLYIALHHGTLIASASRAAVLWASQRPRPAPPAAAATAGQIRFAFEPSMLAAVFAQERRRSESPGRLQDLPERVLADIRTLTLVLEATTEGMTARLAVTPAPGTRLARMCSHIHPPASAFWQLCPEQTTVALGGGGTGIWQLPELYETNAAPAQGALPDDARTGDGLAWIGRTADTGALYFAQIMGITNRSVAWERARIDPPKLLPFETSLHFITNQTRAVQGTPVLDMTRGGFAAAADGKRNLADMAAFMVHDGGLSLAATTNYLVVTFGPTNAIDNILQRLTHPPTNAVPLPARCRKLLPDLPEAPCAVMLLQPAGLIRQVALSLPGMKPELAAALPLPGDGIAVSTTRDKDNTLHLTLRVSANEVARLQEASSKGQAALQEMFMQMTLQQMMQMERKLDAPDPRDPNQQLQR